MGNNYTGTMPNQLGDPQTLTLKDLQAIDFGFDSPFDLPLIEEQVFSGEKVARLIPGKRLVMFGTWQEKPVVGKIFFDNQNAKRHMENDLTGLEILRENKIPTPNLLYRGVCKDQRIFILIFERLFEAKSLDEVWQSKTSVDGLMPLLKAVTVELATQHVLGMQQQDLHLKNFLVTRKRIYTLDGAAIEVFPALLPKKMSMDNLALFLSQLGVGLEKYQEKLFHHYAKSRGWLLKPEDTIDLFLTIKKYNHERWLRFEKKIFRDCTSFACIDNFSTFAMYDRAYAFPEFKKFLQNPDSVFNHPAARMLKAGRSSTVVKITLDNRILVVKRYNIKNVWHRFRRLFRATRAEVSWRLAQKLRLFGLSTARPVAFIEKRCLGFRGKSYYVTEFVSGEHGGGYLQRIAQQEDKISSMVLKMSALLKNLAKIEITHGDLKITNILIGEGENPVLIDLDGATEHSSLSGLRSAWRKEIKRFLENFDDDPVMRERFEQELVKK